MRDIKFRAWDRTSHKMLNLIALRDEEGAVVMQAPEQAGTIFRNSPQNVEVMQFTGLHDKNGKEIYEGDIVKRHGIDPLQEVIWTGCRISLRSLPDNDDYEDLWRCSPQELVVVGNRFENPGLLTANHTEV